MTDYEKALEELRAAMSWKHSEVIYYWEGGGHNPELQEKLDKSFRDLGYRGDSDDLPGFGQFLYELGILSPAALKALDLPFRAKSFMCFWGDGYVGVNEDALREEHDLDYFNADNGFEPEQIQSVKNLFLAGSVQIAGCIEIMSVVRIK